MPVQRARIANLRAVIAVLEQDGMVTRESQATFLGSAVTAHKLQIMLDGGCIPALFAEHVEHVLFRPRGWMSELHDIEADFGEAEPVGAEEWDDGTAIVPA